MRRWCVEGCGRETGEYSKGGRRNPHWCPECDEARIERISGQLNSCMEHFRRDQLHVLPAGGIPEDANRDVHPGGGAR